MRRVYFVYVSTTYNARRTIVKDIIILLNTIQCIMYLNQFTSHTVRAYVRTRGAYSLECATHTVRYVRYVVVFKLVFMIN